MAATYEELMSQAHKLHAAGDTAKAKQLAQIAQQRKTDSADPQRQAVSQEAPATDGVSHLQGGMMNAAQGLFLGAGDEINAGLSAITGAERGPDGSYSYLNYDKPLGERYDAALADSQGMIGQYRQEHPVAATAAEVGTFLVPGAGVAKAAKAGGSALKRAAQGAAAGGATGAVYGFNDGEGGAIERLSNTPVPALTGLALGGAATRLGDYAGGVMRKIQDRKAGNKLDAELRKAGPTIQQLHAKSRQLFKKAEESGVRVKGPNMGVMKGDVARGFAEEGFHPGNNTGIAAIYDDFRRMDGDASLQDLFAIRAQFSPIARNTSPDQAHNASLANIAINSIDEAINRIDGGDVKQARKLWGQMRRAELVESAISRADLAASGFENGLQIEFRRILKSPKLSQGFNEQELKAMKGVVDGDAPTKALRMIGKFGFRLDGGGSGVIPAIGALGAGSAASNPLVGVGLLAAGSASQAAVKKRTGNAAQKLRNRVVSGKSPKALPAPNVGPIYLPGVPLASE